MTTVFADTFYYIAFLSPSDDAHDQAKAFTQHYSGKMVTTEWVLTELADGLAAPVTRQRCVAFIDWLRQDADVRILPATADFFNAGLSLYRNRDDKKWFIDRLHFFCRDATRRNQRSSDWKPQFRAGRIQGAAQIVPVK